MAKLKDFSSEQKYDHPQKDIDNSNTDINVLEVYGETYAKKKDWSVEDVSESMDQLGLNSSEKAIVLRAYFTNKN